MLGAGRFGSLCQAYVGNIDRACWTERLQMNYVRYSGNFQPWMDWSIGANNPLTNQLTDNHTPSIPRRKAAVETTTDRNCIHACMDTPALLELAPQVPPLPPQHPPLHKCTCACTYTFTCDCMYMYMWFSMGNFSSVSVLM